MTSKQAKEFIAKYPDAKSFVKPSHLEELSPLLEVHIEAITVTKGEFHDLQGSYMPHKETLDKFAAAAGVSYNTIAESTRKEGDGCYVGRSQGMVMGPDGKMILGDVCEYEFDVDVRLEELKLKGKTAWDNGQKSSRPYTPAELASERVQLQKVARQRANTGARNRATVSILGMQTGFKNLFAKNDPDTKTVTFLFSRIIVNAKNEMVMNRMLDNLGPSTAMLYGSQGPAQIAAPAAAAEPAMRPVGPGHDDEALAATYDFGDPVTETAPAIDPEVEKLQAALVEYIASGCLRDNGKKACQDALDRGETDPIVLRDLVNKAKAAYEARIGKAGAA